MASMSGRGNNNEDGGARKASVAGSAEGVAQVVGVQVEELGERLHELSIFGDLAPDVGKNELLSSMLSKCLKQFRCKSGSISLFNPDSDELELVVAEGPLHDALLGTRQPLGSGIAGTVAQRQEGIFVEDIEESDEFSKRESERYETNSFACVPIIYRGELLGVLSLSDKESGDVFSAADVGRMLAVAGCSAGTIRQSLHQEKLRGFNIELRRRLDAAIERLQDKNQELARLKNFNESILTSLVLGLIVFDAKFHVTFSNQAIRNLFGFGAPDDMDERFRELNIDCDGRTWQEVLDAVVREGQAVRCSSAQYAADGEAERLGLNISASPLRDMRRRVSGGVIVVEDITEQARIEKRLAAAERHAVIGKLAARVAHELNNPLDGILRFINLSIALKGEDDPTRGYLSECKKGLERMVGIVSSLLEFSRSTYPTHRDTKLNDVVREAVATLRHRASQQAVEVVFDLADNLPDLRCGELVQVFLNLTKNAYDAMKNGGSLSVASRLDGDVIRVTVADTGCGMPEEIMHRVFDPFFTTKGPSEGTGLGLAICYDIIDKHGGKITVESEVDKGTTFTITLPVS
ncbi:MAG: ATP-binding protein [Planctomycetota bacterium]